MIKIESDFYFPYNSHYFSHVISKNDETLHGHNFYEFSLILQGSIRHFTKHDNQTEILKQNEIILVPPTNIHTYQRIRKTKCTHRDLIFRCDFFENICQQFNKELYNMVCAEKKICKVLLTDEQMQFVHYYVNQLSPYSQLSIDVFNSLTTSFLTSLLSFFLVSQQSTAQNKKYPEWINDLIKSVERHSIFKTSWEEIYADVPYTKEHISRTFKKMTGLTLTTFINNHKVKYAAYLLSTTTLSISEILEEINILSSTYFTKLFVKQYSLTPHQYRLKHSLL